MAHACGRDRQDILRPGTDLGHRLARGFTEAAPHVDGIEVVAEPGGHPVLPRATRAHRRARLHVKKQTAAPFAAKVEPHQILGHLFPSGKKRPSESKSLLAQSEVKCLAPLSSMLRR